MVEILEPLEVGDGDTAGVDVHVGDNQAPVLLLHLNGGMILSESEASIYSLTALLKNLNLLFFLNLDKVKAKIYESFLNF